MLNLFNRAELLTTCDRKLFSQFREALVNAGIDYQRKEKDLAVRNCRRGRVGSFGINDAARIEYKLYVHKNDVSRARSLR